MRKKILKIVLPSLFALVKIFQFSAYGQLAWGIIAGAGLGSLAIVIIWRNLKLYSKQTGGD